MKTKSPTWRDCVKLSPSKKDTLPIINGVMLKKDGTAQATDLLQSLIVPVDFEVFSTVIVPRGILNKIPKNNEIERVSVEGGTGIILLDNGVKLTFGIEFHEDDFPKFDRSDRQWREAGFLNEEMLKRFDVFKTLASKDELKEALNGIFVTDNAICAVDGWVMAWADEKTGLNNEVGSGGIIFPLDSLPFLFPGKISLAEHNGEIESPDGARFAWRLKRNRFPDYKNVIPDLNKATTVSIDKNELSKALNTVLPFASSERGNPVYLDMGPKPKICAWSPDGGAEFPLETFSSEKEIGSKYWYDGQKLKRVLSTLPRGSNLLLRLTRPNVSIVIEAKGEKRLIMPIAGFEH